MLECRKRNIEDKYGYFIISLWEIHNDCLVDHYCSDRLRTAGGLAADQIHTVLQR